MVSVLVKSSNWRYYGLNLVTGEWIHRELPLRDVAITEAASGPGGISATIDPDVSNLKNPDGSPILDELSTLIVAEADGVIRAADILRNSDLNGSALALDCTGFSTHATGQILQNTLTYTGNASLLAGGHGVDPLQVVRDMWAQLQSVPKADIGLVVDPTTSRYSLGSFTNVQAQQKDTAHPDGSTDPKEAGEDIPIDRVWGPTDKLPAAAKGKTLTWYYTLNPWDNIDIGAKIDELAKQAPFDYREEASWASDARDAVTLRLRLGAPRLGTRRSNLRFAEGENIAGIVAERRDGDAYANFIYALGAGEGQTQIRTTVSKNDGRLQKTAQFTDSSMATVAALKAAATLELNRLSVMENITAFTVRDHPNAPIGSFEVGDDVLVHRDTGWAPVSLWVRITSATLSPETGDIAIACSRSDSFNYSPGGVSG